jgi:DNA-binding transcriptional ArsR family regulator
MRALAHPCRLALLEVLRETDATATECSPIVGESPSACSYHLRALAKWGLVEPVDSPDGRERRWRSKVGGFRASTVSESTTSPTYAASLMLRQASLEQDARVLTEFFETEEDLPQAWRDVATFVSTSLRLTPERLGELSERLLEVLEEYRGDHGDGLDDEDEGSVHLVIRAIPQPPR